MATFSRRRPNPGQGMNADTKGQTVISAELERVGGVARRLFKAARVRLDQNLLLDVTARPGDTHAT